MKIKLLLIIYLIVINFLYSKNIEELTLNKYLNQWLKKEDSAILFNYKTGRILFEYHSYMFNKKIPIGSVFKIITTFSFYKKNKKKANTYTYNCNNSINNTDNLFCWYKKGHGEVNIEKAFIHSCNKFYYSLNLNLDYLKKISTYLGVNIIFNSNFLKKREKKLVMAGNLPVIKANFYDLSKLLSVFANNGQVIDIKTRKILYYVKEINIIKKIKELMRKVVKNGTAKNSFFKNYGFSGKTGTAKDENNKLYGLFIGFTQNKPYAIIVNIKNNIGATAAMIASDIIYLYDKSSNKLH